MKAARLAASVFVTATILYAAAPAHAGKPAKMSTPTLACAGSTQTSISILVTAGATGAPAGFTIQWMTAADYAVYGWPSPTICDGSFSGNASDSRYALAPGASVTVSIGDLLLDNGTSTTCGGADLLCGTAYVFRAFAHATSSLNRSDFTANLFCNTLACGSTGACTLTQGYWKNHNDAVCVTDATSPLCVHWPITSLTLGTVSYDETQLLAIFATPGKGNGLLTLAHQLIAAKLNIANGADGTAVSTAIVDADTMIGGLVVPPVGTGSLDPSVTDALVTVLANYNQGLTGPGHCGGTETDPSGDAQ